MRQLRDGFVMWQQQVVDLFAEAGFDQNKARPVPAQVEPFKGLPFEAFDVEAQQINVRYLVLVQQNGNAPAGHVNPVGLQGLDFAADLNMVSFGGWIAPPAVDDRHQSAVGHRHGAAIGTGGNKGAIFDNALRPRPTAPLREFGNRLDQQATPSPMPGEISRIALRLAIICARLHEHSIIEIDVRLKFPVEAVEAIELLWNRSVRPPRKRREDREAPQQPSYPVRHHQCHYFIQRGSDIIHQQRSKTSPTCSGLFEPKFCACLGTANPSSGFTTGSQSAIDKCIMLYHRVIPVLLFDDGAIYRSQQFACHYRLGDPLQQLERYKVWDVDEVVYLDMHRTPGGHRLLDVLPGVARNCFAPLAVGGGIRSIDDIHRHLEAGADRVVINTAAFETPSFITDAAYRYGEQAIVVSIDARRRTDGSHEVVVNSGRRPTGRLAAEWAADAASRGAGEILINSIDRDGMGTGYDIELLRGITAAVSIPVIACGGVGSFEHLAAGIRDGGAASVAAANIFGFKELSYSLAKDALREADVSVRANTIVDKARRKPAYPG